MDKNTNFRHDSYAVIIGINIYQDEKIPDLQFARADAEGIYKVLTDPELGRISPDNVFLLLDEEATAKNIRSAIGTKIPKLAGEKDMVYIYYAGHGSPVMDPKSRSRDGMEKYLVPADAELNDLRATGIAMDEIQKFFAWIESKQVMFFIDSCYSGEAGGRTFQNPQYRSRHLLSSEFLEGLTGEGRLVVTACDVNEVSLETLDVGHGLFTHYLIEGLKGLADKDRDGLVTLHELYEYVYDNVSQQARRLGGSMHPVQKGSIKGKIFLTRYETEAQKQAKQMHAQAQYYFDTEKFNEAYDLWLQVIKLVPEHEEAKQGLAEIDRQEEQRKRQKILERRQEILLNLYYEKKMPVDEFELGMTLLEKSAHDLNAIESRVRKLLEDLANGRISVSTYLRSVGLLKTVETEEENVKPKSEPRIKKETSVAKRVRMKETKTKQNKSALSKEPISKVPSKQATTKQFPGKSIILRKTPITLSEKEVKSILKKYNFPSLEYSWNRAFSNRRGKGINNKFETQYGGKVIFDHATGLVWQQSGSPKVMKYTFAENYILKLKNENFAGYDDWRLPTLEEAMSLMKPVEKKGDLHIDPLFDQKQRSIWTADIYNASSAWVVDFESGYCDLFSPLDDYYPCYVRAVCSEQ